MPNTSDSVVTREPDHATDSILVSLKCRRRPSGVELTLKSDIFEEFFKTLSNNAAERVISNDPNHYYTVRHLGTVDGADFLRYPENNQLINSGIVNMFFLRAKGISSANGKVFNIPTVMSNRQLTDFTQLFEEAAVRFYAEYVQPSECEIEVIVKHVGHPA